MKSTLIFSTTKSIEDHRNKLTIERLERKTQRRITKQLNKPIKPKDQYYTRNSEAISKNNQQQQQQLLNNSDNSLLTYHKDLPKYCLNDLIFFELNNDAIEQQKFNILHNSLLPIDQLFGNTVQTYLNGLHNSEKSIGWLIADYVLKFRAD